MAWHNVENGATIGTHGSEGGLIERDEVHSDGARITIERDGGSAPLSITCGVYGWFFHTRFFGSREEANRECDLMKYAMEAILGLMPPAADPQAEEEWDAVVDAMQEFVARFP